MKQKYLLKGDKLFNQNTPFVININSPQPKEGEKKVMLT